MLTEQRYEMILNLLEENKSVTVTQIKELLHISESTARRDITALHQAGKLIDGHSPGLKGDDLSAYVTAGIHTDHEGKCKQRTENTHCKVCGIAD